MLPRSGVCYGGRGMIPAYEAYCLQSLGPALALKGGPVCMRGLQ